MKQILQLCIFLVFAISISCTQQRESRITKFIFIEGLGLSYDSLEKPQLEITKYLEYSHNAKVMIATGKRFFNYPDFEKAPAFSLTEFYEFQNFDTLETFIDNTFIGNSFDSIYSIRVTEGHNYNYFIYETSTGEKKEILYYEGALPGKLDSLDKFVNRLFVTHKIVKTEKFAVHPLVIELQNRLFKKFPPPPLPAKPAELPQRVKFEPQQNNDQDSKQKK